MAICLKVQTGAHTRPLHQGPWKAIYAPEHRLENVDPKHQTRFLSAKNVKKLIKALLTNTQNYSNQMKKSRIKLLS